jgi:polyprenyl-phospho-N-acetylgalactosaminyl synthase
MTTALPFSRDETVADRFSASDVCVIVSVYNEASVLGDVLADLRRHFDLVVCVDDASSDGSGAIARAAGAVVVTHPINRGAGAALQTGLTYALQHTRANVFLTFDGDGQHRVVDAVTMVRPVLTGEASIALGSRFLGGGDGEVPSLRRLVLRMGVHFTRMTTHLSVTDTHNGLRAIGRGAAELIALRMRGMAHGSEFLRLVAVHRISYVEMPVHIHYTDYSRAKGQSNLNAFNILADVFLQGVYRGR